MGTTFYPHKQASAGKNAARPWLLGAAGLIVGAAVAIAIATQPTAVPSPKTLTIPAPAAIQSDGYLDEGLQGYVWRANPAPIAIGDLAEGLQGYVWQPNAATSSIDEFVVIEGVTGYEIARRAGTASLQSALVTAPALAIPIALGYFVEGLQGYGWRAEPVGIAADGLVGEGLQGYTWASSGAAAAAANDGFAIVEGIAGYQVVSLVNGSATGRATDGLQGYVWQP